MPDTPTGKPLHRVRELLGRGSAAEAVLGCERLLEAGPPELNTLLLFSRALEAQFDFPRMLVAARQAVELKPNNTDANLRLAECLYLSGDVAGALDNLRDMEATAGGRHRLLMKAGDLYEGFGQRQAARRCHLQAMESAPQNAACHYRAARSCLALGMRRQAENILQRAIYLDPGLHAAWYLRSVARTQTRNDNHVKQLSYLIDGLGPEDPGRVPLCYALARELDDLGRYDESFVCLSEGARQRRDRVTQDLAEDEGRMAAIARCFDRQRFAGTEADRRPERPVFVVGLPGSGAARVARLIGAHSQAVDLGNTRQLELALFRMVGGHSGHLDLVRQSASVDFGALGQSYMDAVAGFGHSGIRPVDATRCNYLHLGLIRLALPGARVVHVRRDPVDNCMAIYRTLGAERNPWRYDLADIGRYYIAYHDLMAHWRSIIPDGFLEVDFDQLRTTRRNQARRLLDGLGLPWEDASLMEIPEQDADFNIRLRYAQQLGPLREQLRAGGIDAG